MTPVGMLVAGVRLVPPCPHVLWELSLQWGMAWQGRAGKAPSFSEAPS